MYFSDPNVNFVSKGCYTDEADPNGVMPVLEPEDKSNDIVTNCAAAAYTKNYHYFAIQDEDKCYGTACLGVACYNKHGTSDLCNGKFGGPLANKVYELKLGKLINQRTLKLPENPAA